MSGFFEEVKRRKVYRVAVAYVVVGGGIIQLASAVFPAWDLPAWSQRLVTVLLLIGFPIALILAWAYDVTPEGIRATEPAPSLPSRRRGRRNLFILLAIGVLVSSLAGFFVLPRALARKMDKSIAVLPFENLSDDKENAHFADGIQDDILTNLAKIGDLKVISRTSVMGYRDKPSSVREIGKTLGVSAILEGSVRTDPKNNRVRVNVQLINAANDQHLWAEDYDRDLTDVFAIQTDLAQKIANELQAKLSPTEKAQMMRKPTENGEAYLAFLQAMNLFVPEDITKLKQAEQLYERAIALDPNFALAMAGYSHLESWIYHTFDAAPARRTKARELADNALKLQPELPEAHLALGYCYYYGDLDYERALSEFKIAQSGLPNDAEVLLSLGAIQRRQGKWAESTANFEKAATLNPKSAWVLQNLGLNYKALRNYEAAEKTFDRGLAVADPEQALGLHGLKAQLAVAWKGDLSVGEEALKQVPADFDPDGLITEARIGTLMFQRRFTEALVLLHKLPTKLLHGENGVPTPKSLLEGICYFFSGDKANARSAFENAREFLEKQVVQAPNDASRHARLGLIYAALDRKADAIREGKRAVELLPESKDAFDGPDMTLMLAQIYTWTGEPDQALSLIEHSLTVPAGVTVPLLKLDAAWDPLRNDPRFQALLEKYGAKT